LPSIFGGLKVASTLAVVGALTGEFIGSDKGLGYVLLQASGNLNTTLLFATLVALSVLAMLFFYAVEAVERLAIPWHVSQRGQPA
jgi:NitT/TauT family transport system permease protein